MKSIFDKFNKMKLETQDKFLTFALKDSLNPDYQKSFNKKHFGKGCSLDIQAEAEKKITEVKSRAFELVNIYNKSSLGLLNYIEERGYKVVKNENAKKLLKLINEKPGFIPEAKGLKALLINILSGTTGFKSEPLFIIEKEGIPITEFLHDFYLWVAMDMNLPGFDADTRKIFIKYFIKGEDSLLKNIHIKQMLMLKEAVSRDKEAIEFVIEFEKHNKNSKTVHSQEGLPDKIFI